MSLEIRWGRRRGVAAAYRAGAAWPPARIIGHKVLNGEKVIDYRVIFNSHNKAHYYDVNGTPIYDIEGNFVAGVLCCRDITSKVEFIAGVYVYPGEDELEALASNALRVASGEIEPLEYPN